MPTIHRHHARHFRSGLALTALIAVLALALAHFPAIGRLGPLTLALLLGLLWSAFNHVPRAHHSGISFSARQLLRLGIILLGVRLNLDLILQAGPRILLLDVTVVTIGLIGISWLGRRLGLAPTLAALIAVDTSICGASAVAAAAPTLRAREDEVALVIPMCSLLGTLVVLGYTVWQHLYPLDSLHYGMLAGSTLHEIAQVMAAVGPFPDAANAGTVTKLTRVILLVPAIFALSYIAARRERTQNPTDATAQTRKPAAPLPKPWFVLGFLIVGAVNTLLLRLLPEQHDTITALGDNMLTLSTFLMAMAMAGMGLQVNFAHLRANGLRAAMAAIIGWIILAAIAFTQIHLLA